MGRTPSVEKILPDLYPFKLVLNNIEDYGTQPGVVDHYAVLPHEVFHSLHLHAPQLFQELFGTSDQLAEYWQHAQRTGGSWYTNHPIVASEPDPSKRVPYGLHDDDAGMHGSDQTLCITWGPVAGNRRTTLDTRIAFSMIKCYNILVPATTDEVYSVLRWSLDALGKGEFPDRDHVGTLFSKTHHPNRFRMVGHTLAGGLKGCWESMRGDWKYLKESLGLQQHYGQPDRICHLCDARKNTADPRMRMTDFRRDAPHRDTLVDGNAFMQQCLRAATMSPLLLIAGFCIWRVNFDFMHTHDLGTLQYMQPCVLKELVSDPGVFRGATVPARLNEAYRQYSIWCESNIVKARVQKKITKAWWKPKKHKYPQITQLTAKAAALRSMSYWLASVCKKHTSNPHDAMRAAMITSFVEADKVCRRSGRHFTVDQHEAFCKHLEAYLTCYNALAVEAYNAQPRKYLYKISPKFHAGTHAYDSMVNPRFVHCYADEDMVGRLKKIYSNCHGATASRRALERYALVVCMRWWAALHELRGLPYLP